MLIYDTIWEAVASQFVVDLSPDLFASVGISAELVNQKGGHVT